MPSKITEVLMLRNQLLSLKDKGETESEQYTVIYDKYRDLAGKLFWDFGLV